MCWVKTQDGNLCNLSLATDLRIRRNHDSGTWDLLAYFTADTETTTLGVFATKEEAVDVLARIAKTLPARDVQMPPRPEPRPEPRPSLPTLEDIGAQGPPDDDPCAPSTYPK